RRSASATWRRRRRLHPCAEQRAASCQTGMHTNSGSIDTGSWYPVPSRCTIAARRRARACQTAYFKRSPMGKVGVFLYDGFQEMEFWYPVLRLREIGADVVAIGVDGTDAVVSVLGYPVVPNVAMASVSPRDFAALIVPGGNVAKLGGNANFAKFL